MAYTTIDDPSQYFQTATYTGNGGTQNITNDGNSDLQPDWVWIKDRTSANDHKLTDSSRLSSGNPTLTLESNTNIAEFNDTDSTTAYLTDGFSIGANGNINTNGNEYVAWQWKANGGTLTTVSESGSNPGHTRQTNATAGFSIIRYTGTGSVGTIAHGLGIVPDFIILKRLETADNWRTYDSIGGGTKAMRLNLTGGHGTSSSFFNDTDATSSVFTLGTNSEINGDGEPYIAYVFGSVKGYSKIGAYKGVGNTDGNFVYTGFKPAFFMIKGIDVSGYWVMFDNKRNLPNGTGKRLGAQASDAEYGSTNIDFLSNGFKIRSSSGSSDDNNNGSTYFYMAFAEHPFVSSKGVPTTAR